MPIKSYSTTASSNNASPPNGFPEGMAPASLNDGMRQVMADIRTWYESPTYIDLGDVPTFISTTSFSVTGNKTTTYPVGARIRASGTTPFTIFGTIATSTFSTVTTITVTWDSGSLNSTLNAVAVVNIPDDAIVSSKIRSLAAAKLTGTVPIGTGGTGLTALETTVASASTVDLGAQLAPIVNVTGTTTITSFGTVASGTFRNVIFSGILTLTHNATSLILPSGANITTAAGDKLEAVSLGSGNWRVVSYERASGQALVSQTYLGLGDAAQSWQSVTRTAGVTYTNSTGRPICLNVTITMSTNNVTSFTSISINGGSSIDVARCGGGAVPQTFGVGSIIIPVGATYVLTDQNLASRTSWELR